MPLNKETKPNPISRALLSFLTNFNNAVPKNFIASNFLVEILVCVFTICQYGQISISYPIDDDDDLFIYL